MTNDALYIEAVEQMFDELFGGKKTQKMRKRQARMMREIETDEKEMEDDERNF